MIIEYTFADGYSTEVEVSEEIGAAVVDSRRLEENLSRKERYHCISLDAVTYEGQEFTTEDFVFGFFEAEERCEQKERIMKAFSHLTDVQKRRMIMLASGLSEREISRCEGKDIKTIRESIEAARKKLKKFL